MVSRVNGGVRAGQNLTGHLEFLKIVSTSATYLDESDVPNSDLEVVTRLIMQRGTIVILSVESNTTIHVAMENAGDGWTDDADSVAGSLAKIIKDNSAATAVAVTVGSFRVA